MACSVPAKLDEFGEARVVVGIFTLGLCQFVPGLFAQGNNNVQGYDICWNSISQLGGEHKERKGVKANHIGSAEYASAGANP